MDVLNEYYQVIKVHIINTISPTLSSQLKSYISPQTLLKVQSTFEQIESHVPTILQDFSRDFDLSRTTGLSPLVLCIASIAFNPIFWNIVARAEHQTRVLTKLAMGNKYLACYALAATIFTLGLLRDHLYLQVLQDPRYPVNSTLLQFRALGVPLFVIGNVLVLSSMYKLGVTGTFLGDYSGIFMDERVTSFPFNVSNNPMYHGSFLSFLGTALWYGKGVGVLLSLEVLLMYQLACRFENEYTDRIYAERSKKQV